ncbi:MAG: hypothetical protein AAGI15_17120, partial [Pseudomonadota bacterium]
AAARIRAEEQRNARCRDRVSLELGQAHAEITRWETRAIELPESRRADALECVARAEYETARAEQLSASLARYQEQATLLGDAVREAEGRLTELRSRRTELSVRARQAQLASLGRSSTACEQADARVACGVFARWEESVMADEYRSGAFVPVVEGQGVDDFSRGFESQERADARAERLAALRAQAPRSSGTEDDR